jgi:hypothetical protein
MGSTEIRDLKARLQTVKTRRDKMILGIPTSVFTQLHVLISLIGIVTGIVVLLAMLKGQHARYWVNAFLVTTIATSVTGFMFHSKFGPPHAIGAISLVILTVALAALYVCKLQGRWRWVYVTSAAIALYLNIFVAVVQTFQKVAFFHSLAPTQAEPPFAIAQGIVLVAFIALGIVAAKRFHPSPDTIALV